MAFRATTKAIVTCRIGSLENRTNPIPPHQAVTCRIGSLEKYPGAAAQKQHVTCRIGSLEKTLVDDFEAFQVTCRIGSLESTVELGGDILHRYLPNRQLRNRGRYRLRQYNRYLPNRQLRKRQKIQQPFHDVLPAE